MMLVSFTIFLLTYYFTTKYLILSGSREFVFSCLTGLTCFTVSRLPIQYAWCVSSEE